MPQDLGLGSRATLSVRILSQLCARSVLAHNICGSGGISGCN